MVAVCFYFQVHQPNRLRRYTFFDIGHIHDYEDDKSNREILLKVAHKCYLPTNAILLDLIKKYHGAFKVSFSISGTTLEQFRKFCPEVIDSFKRLVDTNLVELLSETYYHSLSFLFSQEEFKEQVYLHQLLMQEIFGYRPTTFRNTELIYNNDIAKCAEELGYTTILAEGADKVLGWKSPNFVYQPKNCKKMLLLLKNYRLSDDIAFRFSNHSWAEYPLTAEKYAHWLHTVYPKAQVINLFMDYETFGEHQWQETGIFEFLNKLPEYTLKHRDYSFAMPGEIRHLFKPADTLDIPYFVSWADSERDLTAWRGNALQEDALQTVYRMEKTVKASKNPKLLHKWRSLQTSDHFYYMCTKYSQDGDVHKYFNPYHSPYEAYINYQNIMSDLAKEIKKENIYE